VSQFCLDIQHVEYDPCQRLLNFELCRCFVLGILVQCEGGR